MNNDPNNVSATASSEDVGGTFDNAVNGPQALADRNKIAAATGDFGTTLNHATAQASASISQAAAATSKAATDVTNGVVAAGKEGGTDISNGVKKAAADAKDAASKDSDKTKDDHNGLGDFMSNGGVGKVIGGLLGLGGAWFLGNFFGGIFGGGGFWGTVLTVALAIPLSIIGSDKLGGWINGMFDHKDAKQPDVASTVPAKGAGIDKTKPAPTVALTNPVLANDVVMPTLVDNQKVVLELSNAELVDLLSKGDHQHLTLYTAGDNQLKARPSSPGEKANIEDIKDLIATVKARVGGAIDGIAFVADGKPGLAVAAVVPRAAASQSRQ